ncbi:MAG: ChaN family lipoprotein [Rhodobacter sp.]|nr:ChaN family lipoprotein [Rhodobacter sp.]
MRRSLPSCAAAGVLAAVSFSAAAEQIDTGELYRLPPADVVILGELHDNPAHHAHQAIAVATMGAQALVFEMLTERQALRITPELLASEDRLEHALQWEAGGWPDFSMYYPIFLAAEQPVFFGGAVERDLVRAAVSDGAADVMGGSAALFGLDRALDDGEQATREAGQMAAHCDALPEEMLGGMVEAQRLRDAGLARAVIAAVAETGGPVAVITGNGHAREDWGIPRALEFAAPELDVITVAQFESVPGEAVPYDYWLVTDPAERDDPCAVFDER